MVERINLLNFLSPVAEGVTANVKGKMSTREMPNGVFLHVDQLLLDLNIKKPRLSVAKIFNNNRILSESSLPHRIPYSMLKFVKNLQRRPQICSWKRMDTKSWKPCNRSCRKSWVLSSRESPTRCSTTSRGTTSCSTRRLARFRKLLKLFSPPQTDRSRSGLGAMSTTGQFSTSSRQSFPNFLSIRLLI